MHTTIVSVREQRTYAVYAKHQSSCTAPLGRVTEDQAMWMLQNGGATWFNNRGRSLRLTDDESPARDSACQMGPRVILAVALGQKWAIAILEAWVSNHHGKVPTQSGSNGRIAVLPCAVTRRVFAVSANAVV